MHVETKLNPGIILVVDDDARRRTAVIDAVSAAFDAPVINPCTWAEHDRSSLGVRADLVILTPNLQNAEETDRLEDVIRSLGSTPTVVLTELSEPQRAVNAVLAGASDAIVMDGAYLRALPARLRKTLARIRTRSVHDHGADESPDALNRTRQENDHLRTRIVSLRAVAMLDPLTGLGNRRALDANLARLWDIAELCDTDLSCLVLDIDNFKRVNDALGHAAGDHALALLARILLEQSRQDDVAIRFGGDEFVVLLPGATTEQGEQVAGRIQKQFDREAANIGRAPVPCTLSIGVSSRKRNRPAHAEDLIVHADEAMYIAKRSGKNRIELGARTGASAPRLASAG